MKKASHITRVCIVPELSGVGGMVSFQKKFSEGLKTRHIGVTCNLEDSPFDAVLVIGGTRNIPALLQLRREGIPIIQRLDGMNWLHRANARKGIQKIQFRHFLRAESGNILLSFIRRYIADTIIYQSVFVRKWWGKVHGDTKASDAVIYNGVDLEKYRPDQTIQRPKEKVRILLVEGNLMGGYEWGLETAIKFIKEMLKINPQSPGGKLELMVVGRVPAKIKEYWKRELEGDPDSKEVNLVWKGLVPPEIIPSIDNSAHLLYSSDINAACPNSVIEALACGLPVLSFDTGALPELVSGNSGRIVPYGGDPWKLDPPDLKGLASAAREIIENQNQFRGAARTLSEKKFDLHKMVDAYLEVLIG